MLDVAWTTYGHIIHTLNDTIVFNGHRSQLHTISSRNCIHTTLVYFTYVESMLNVILLCFQICHSRWICAWFGKWKCGSKVFFGMVWGSAKFQVNFVDWSLFFLHLLFGFLIILFMVFVLSYERCSNNSYTQDTHSHTHRCERIRTEWQIYLQFSSFDLATLYKFWTMCWYRNCTKCRTCRRPSHICCINI